MIAWWAIAFAHMTDGTRGELRGIEYSALFTNTPALKVFFRGFPPDPAKGGLAPLDSPFSEEVNTVAEALIG